MLTPKSPPQPSLMYSLSIGSNLIDSDINNKYGKKLSIVVNKFNINKNSVECDCV